MFKITVSEIARAVQSAKGYVYDFGGRRFYILKVCRSDGCGFDFCAGLSRGCLDTARGRMAALVAAQDEMKDIEFVDSRVALAGEPIMLQEGGRVVVNDILAENCLIVKFEGPANTRLAMIPGRLYVVGSDLEQGTENGLLVRAVSGTHATDIFGRLHDLRCSLTAKLLVEGALDRKVGPGVANLNRPLHRPRFDPERGTMLIEDGDIADPTPHEVRGLSEEEQRAIVEGTKSPAGGAVPSVFDDEMEFVEAELLEFESHLVAGASLLGRFGSTLVESGASTSVSSSVLQMATDAIGRFGQAAQVFGLVQEAASPPVRPANWDDIAYAVSLVNHADSQVEGMRRKIVFKSCGSSAATTTQPPARRICAGLVSVSTAFGGDRIANGDVSAAVGKAAQTVAARTQDLLNLSRQNRLDADTMVRAHRVWFRLEAYRQRILNLDPVFRMDRSALAGLSEDALKNIASQIGAATAELYLALRVLGVDTRFGRTTVERDERAMLYQSLNAHPSMLQAIASAMADMMKTEPVAVAQPPVGSEDSSPFDLLDQGFGIPPRQLDEIEQAFADSLGPRGFDASIGVVPADAQAILESKLSALFGAPVVSGAIAGSFTDMAERSALYEGGRIAPQGDFA